MFSVKIAYLGDGNSIHLRRWMEYFICRGDLVYLLTSNPIKPIDQLNIVPLSFNRFFSRIPVLSSVLNSIYLQKIISRIQPDILHAHYVSNYGYMGTLMNFHPYLVTVWGSDWLIDPKRSWKIRFRTERALKKADAVITNNVRIKNDISEKLHLDNVMDIQWGVNLDVFQRSGDKKILRAELRIPENAYVLISPRMLTPLYNIDMIIKSFADIKTKNKFLVVMGTGPQKPALQDLARSLKVDERVLFTGYIANKDMNRYYNASDLLVSIPDSDSRPMSVLEGLAAGLPVLISRIPGLHEWFEEKQNGFILERPDRENLSQKIEYCSEHTEEMERISLNNTAYINEFYNEKYFQKKMLNLYQKMTT